MSNNDILDSMSLQEYLRDTATRMPKESGALLSILNNEGPMNMNRLSLTAEINRTLLNRFITPLEVMGLIKQVRYGMTKEYTITPLGEAFLKIIN